MRGFRRGFSVSLALATALGCVPIVSVQNAPDGGSRDAGPTDAGSFAPAAHLAYPMLPDHGGPKLSPLRVVSVVAPDEPYADPLKAFGDALVKSRWLAALAPAFAVAATGTHVMVRGEHVQPGTSFTQAAMNAYIKAAVATASPSPEPDGHTVYVLYLPPGTVLDNAGTPDTTCALVPYHTEYGTLGDAMAVLNRCPTGFADQLEMFTVVASHEIIEAATDPQPSVNPAWELWVDTGQPVYQASLWNQVEVASSMENGDLCIGTKLVEDGFGYQRVYTNAAGAAAADPCVPALPVPFYSVTVDPTSTGWFPVAAGQTLTVPLTGWSSAPSADWFVTVETFDLHQAHFTAHVESPTQQAVGQVTYRTTNNGRSLSLVAKAPATAARGWWGVVKLWSWKSDAQGNTPAGEDYSHEALVGLYVP
jgi:hypothetical protein